MTQPPSPLSLRLKMPGSLESRIKANSTDLDILITDISMPVMSGTELCKAVKQQFNHVKVLIFSMYNSEPVIKKNILAEADGFILKTSGKEELLEALHKIADNSTYFSLALIPTISELIKKYSQHVIKKPANRT